jgi:hypothetical protein
MKAEKSLYAGWDLREITLVFFDHRRHIMGWPRGAPIGVMRVFTECIPSIQSFWKADDTPILEW